MTDNVTKILWLGIASALVVVSLTVFFNNGQQFHKVKEIYNSMTVEATWMNLRQAGDPIDELTLSSGLRASDIEASFLCNQSETIAFLGGCFLEVEPLDIFINGVEIDTLQEGISLISHTRYSIKREGVVINIDTR